MTTGKNSSRGQVRATIIPPRYGKTFMADRLEKVYKALSEDFPKVVVLSSNDYIDVKYQTESGVEVILGTITNNDSEEVVNSFVETCKTILNGFLKSRKAPKNPSRAPTNLEQEQEDE